MTSNLPFDEWTAVFGSERLTGALLDRLTHHVHILEMNGESYRLATAKKVQRRNRDLVNAGPMEKGGANRRTETPRAHWAALRYAPRASTRATTKLQGPHGPFLETRPVHFYVAILHILSPLLTAEFAFSRRVTR